jgi:hypothetical protein
LDTVDRARAYLAKLPAAIAGQAGHNATMEAAVVLVRGFDLSKGDALALLESDYNPRCQPRWKRAELQHKVNDAVKGPGTGTGPPVGYLLGKGERGTVERTPEAPARDWRATAGIALPSNMDTWPPSWREAYEERAAIMEHDGELDREDAERRAAELVRAQYAGRT